ncbi:phage tail tape measure protein [Kitasatospora sp. HPMI-4]|uniref:phage tail tape measure protein n=1 Tax=Kitasatospora sp. HPMI-4 TaxID=3448443 RepID=UPI003F1A154F
MADRAVNVRLTLDTSLYRRGAQQAEQDTRRIALAAQQTAATEQTAFNRASTSMVEAASRAGLAQQRAAELSAQAAVAAGAVISETATRSAAATLRISEAAADVPATFRAAGVSGSAEFGQLSAAADLTSRSLVEVGGAAARSLGQIATQAGAASLALAQTSTAMTAEMAAAATGTDRVSLASRLAIAEVVTAQQAAAGAIASTTEAAAAAQTGLLARARAASLAWATSVNTAAASSTSTITTAATAGEKALGVLKTGSLALVAAFLAASVTAAKFGKSMSGVQAVADATSAQMGQLRTAALEAGRDTAYSASQAADAEGELARAGVSVANITGGALKGALSLAAAGQLSLSESAELAAQAMNTFGLKGKDVSHIADVLAAGANKSAADVHGLGESLRMGGLVAQQTGLSLEDTVGVLSAFADHALIGSDAGTSLKVMLQRLTPQSKEAEAMMQKLGFSAYDTSGNFVGLSELAGRLQRSFGNLTPEARNSAMGVIFGSDAVRAATVLYGLGSVGIDEYTRAVNDQGAAQRMASIQLDNLSGDLVALKGSLEVALIEGGSAANKVLREMAQFITAVVNGYASLPPWLQITTTATMGIVGAIGLAAAGFMLILPRIAAFQTSLTALAATMPRLAAAASFTTGILTGPWGIGIGLAVTALGVFGLANRKAKADVQDLTEAVKADSGAVSDNVRTLVAQKLQQSGALDTARKYGLSLAMVTDAALGNKTALEQVNRALQDTATHQEVTTRAQFESGRSTTALNSDAAKLQKTLKGTSGDLQDAVQAYKNQQEATGGAADANKKLGGTVKTTTEDLKDQETAVKQLTDALDMLNGANIDSAQSAIRYQASLADLTSAVKDNGVHLDITSEKGRKVKQAVLDAADAAMKHAEAVTKQQNSIDAGNVALAQDVDALKKTMQQAGFTQTQIEALTAAYAQIPESKRTEVTDPGALQTIADLRDIRQKVEDVPPGKSINVRAPTAAAIQDLEAIGYKVESLPDGRVRVTVPTNDAFDGANRIQQAINGIEGRTVTVRIHYSTSAPGHMGEAFANGGITGYAAGGITAAADGLDTREAGISTRAILWAEAGPEAYIPLSPSKRARSTRLLSTVAEQFGYQLMPVASRDLIQIRSLAGPAPAPAPAEAAPTPARGLTIEHYYEAPSGSARSTAEELWWLSRTRG